MSKTESKPNLVRQIAGNVSEKIKLKDIPKAVAKVVAKAKAEAAKVDEKTPPTPSPSPVKKDIQNFLDRSTDSDSDSDDDADPLAFMQTMPKAKARRRLREICQAHGVRTRGFESDYLCKVLTGEVSMSAHKEACAHNISSKRLVGTKKAIRSHLLDCVDEYCLAQCLALLTAK